MTTEVTKKFLISDIDPDGVWLKLLEGRKKGLVFFVPKDVGGGEKLCRIGIGKEISAKLISLNEDNTLWACHQVLFVYIDK